MMILYIVLIIIIVYFDLRLILAKKNKSDIVIYISIAVVAMILSIIANLITYENSISYFFLKLFKVY